MKLMNSAQRSSREAMSEDRMVDALLRDAHAHLGPKLAIIRRPEVAIGAFKTPIGPLLIAEGASGLVMVHYMEGGHTEERLEALRRKFDPVKDAHAVEPVVREIRQLLHGETDALKRKVDLTWSRAAFAARCSSICAKFLPDRC